MLKSGHYQRCAPQVAGLKLPKGFHIERPHGPKHRKNMLHLSMLSLLKVVEEPQLLPHESKWMYPKFQYILNHCLWSYFYFFLQNNIVASEKLKDLFRSRGKGFSPGFQGLWITLKRWGVTSLLLTRRARVRSPVGSFSWLRFFPGISLNIRQMSGNLGHIRPRLSYVHHISSKSFTYHLSTDGNDLWP